MAKPAWALFFCHADKIVVTSKKPVPVKYTLHLVLLHLNKLNLPISGVLQIGLMGKTLGYYDEGPGFEPHLCTFFSTTYI